MRRRHNRKSIKGKKTFAFVVDGKTEFWYLQMLKRNERNLDVSIEPKLPNKKNVLEQYEMVQSLANNYTKVFWIVDYDVIRKETKESKSGTETPEQQFIKYREKLLGKNENVIVIVNDPCLEFWLLLHFENTAKFYSNCASSEKQLKKHLKNYIKNQKYYTKQNQDIYLKLKPFLQTGITHSAQLHSFDKTHTNRAICEMNLLYESKEISKIIGK